jgi:hypothetical protein
MRASILLWSTASGVIIGTVIDTALIGVALMLSSVIPGVLPRLSHRWIVTSAVVVLLAVPVFLGFLGFLEGQLKAR